MPIYNPYNEVVQPAKYVAPLDLNLLLKGTQYKQEQSEKNFNEIQGQVNNLLSIPAYGKDKEILNQKLQELQQVMGGLDVTNLETPQAKQQINSLINQFSQDKDVQAVAQRGNSYQNMMAEKQDFDKKGKVYMNQGLRKLNKYYSGDDYIRDVKFSNYGYEAPDAGKIMEEVKKIVTPSKKQVPGLNGTMQEIEEYEPEALKKAFEAVTNSMPTYKQSLIDNLDNSLEGQDVNELAIKKYQPLLAQYQQNETNAMWLASQTSDPALKTKYLNDAQSAREGINLAQQVLQNPYSGLAYKQAELSSLMNQDLKNMTDALTFHKEGERKMTDVAKMNAEHSHDFEMLKRQQAKEIAVATAKGELQSSKLPELDKLVYTAVLNSGKPIYDATGNKIPANQLASENGIAYNPKESMDNKTSSGGEENQMPKKLRGVFDTINSGTALNSTEEEDLAAYVDSNRDALDSKGSDEIKNVTYKTENGLKVITWDIDDLGLNTSKKAFVVNSQEDYDRIPKGSIFIDSTGKPTTKQ